MGTGIMQRGDKNKPRLFLRESFFVVYTNWDQNTDRRAVRTGWEEKKCPAKALAGTPKYTALPALYLGQQSNNLGEGFILGGGTLYLDEKIMIFFRFFFRNPKKSGFAR